MQCSYFSFSVKVQGVDKSQWLFQTKLNLVWNFQDIDNGHQNFPNQSEFGLESASCKIPFFLSKPNWNWFGKSDAFFGCIFSKPNWIWFGKGHWMKSSCTVHPALVHYCIGSAPGGKKLGNKRAWARKQSISRLQSWFLSTALKTLNLPTLGCAEDQYGMKSKFSGTWS